MVDPLLLGVVMKLRHAEAKRRGLVQGFVNEDAAALDEAELGRFRFLDGASGERPLPGGAAARVGDTVRKPIGPQTTAVFALAEHLAHAGFGGTPRALDIDDAGREVWSWTEGEVGVLPLAQHHLSNRALAGVGHLLRGLHDATVGFALPDGAAWPAPSIGPEPHEVVAHGDPCPSNIVFGFDGRPVALLDLEHAGPAPRWWDLAMVAYHLVPMARDQQCRRTGFRSPPDRAARLAVLLDAYRVPREHRAAFLPWVSRRLEWHLAAERARAISGDRRAAMRLDEGLVPTIERDLAWLDDHGPAIGEAAAQL